MLWLILSILTALAVATQDTWVKRFFSHLSAYDMVGYPAIYSLPLFVIAAILAPRPDLDAIFWWCFLASLPLNGISFVIYMQAIKISPLSLTLPYLAFTPVFMIASGSLILNEMPNDWGLLGIVTTCLGSYVLNLNPAQPRWTAPLRAVFNETGSWMMLLVAFIFSIAAVVGKKGILHSTPLFFNMSFFAAFNFLFLVVLRMFGKIRLSTFREQPVHGLVAGGLIFAHALLHGFAISLTKAAYMISIKRFSILFGVIYGGLVFKEPRIVIRFLGAALMLSGAILIVLKGS
jgi:drug/metabolite transporter (DMT)-like permease